MGKAQTVIRAKALLDGTGAPPVPNAVVVVEGSRILAAGPEEAVAAPRGPDVRELDYPDAYLLPGLIDAHTHLMFGAGEATYEEVIERDTDEIMLLRAARNAHIHLNAGVTTLRDCGARNQVTFDLRRGVDQGLSLAPRLLLSGRPVTVTGGHFWWCNGEADGVQGVRKAVRRLVEDGADFIKIMASGGGTAGTDNRRPSFSVEELRAIVDEAHNQGVPTTAHCIATQSIANALDAGVDSIEHATFIEPDGSYRFNPHIAERIADQGVRVSPTVQTGYRRREKLLAMREEGHALTPMDKSRLEDLQIKCERQVEFLGRLWSEWGITIVAGTDAISSFGDYCLGLELQVEAGMSTAEVIRSATGVAAQAVGLDHLVGTLEPGKEADLIVVDQDPLADIRALRSMRMVMQRGGIVPPPPAMS
ncbi:MAG: amidohydrolase family protein [Acidimicrobiia bacterium]|nr:amidohydrolase family protein [Acidimicrobiia bacterium]MXX46057.1 amidohydrolase family protein [Acidimicrobiia bacterium]MYB79629.1 amidohydrolase family protein [Acidimicrobiia bacterium]MYD40133.1 amidohydrolase family protein [Acidimicrobiia bacterium]